MNFIAGASCWLPIHVVKATCTYFEANRPKRGESRHPMTMKKTLPVKARTRTSPVEPSSPYGRLHTLLHTVRCIAQHEDALCELSHEVQQSGQLSEETKVALDALLKKIPSHEYAHDLDAVTVLLIDTPQPASAALKRTPSTPSPRKQVSVTRKSGRKSSN